MQTNNKINIATFDEYQAAANKTAIYPKERGLEYCILGLAGEAGECAGKFSKVIRDNNGVLSLEYRTALIKELGDVFWFCAQACKELNIDMHEVASLNIEKLQDRQKRGVLQGSSDNR